MIAGDVDLPADASAAGHARRHVRSWLRDHDLEQLTETATLLTSELVTNAVLHTSDVARLTLQSVPGGLRVEIQDASPAGPVRRRHSPRATTGRGLALLAELADTWGWEPQATGKVVWFTVTTAADPWAAYTGTDWLAEAQL
ncbi:MAG: putative anti-sigma regulatory factor, serine/threonine protein kinase [Frankiales bacterium]|nr:putative anti-sigma regulatory factor, serine/threonine protein kinase [Frankiales bacterium]